MHTRIIVISAVVFLGGCATGPNVPTLSPAPQRLSIDGLDFASPAEPGWYIPLQTPYHLALAKRGASPDETVAIEAQLYHAPAPVPGKDFVQQVREAQDKDTDPARFTSQVHEVVPYKLGAAVCARSHTTVQDNKAATPSGNYAVMILEAYSLDCEHPQDPRAGVNLTYSLRYYPGKADPGWQAKAAAILDSAQLGELKE